MAAQQQRILLPMQEMGETRVVSLCWTIPWRRKWQITPVFLPGKAMDRGAWLATVHESDMTEHAHMVFHSISINSIQIQACSQKKRLCNPITPMTVAYSFCNILRSFSIASLTCDLRSLPFLAVNFSSTYISLMCWSLCSSCSDVTKLTNIFSHFTFLSLN